MAVDDATGVLPPFELVRSVGRVDSFVAKSDLSWVRKLGEGRKIEAKVGVNSRRQSNDAMAESFDFGDRLALAALSDTTNTDDGVTASGKYSTPLMERHALAVGWDGGWSRRSEERFKRENSPVGLVPDNLDEEAKGRVERLAVFAQDEWSVSERWSVYAGVRWEEIATNVGYVGEPSGRNRSSVWSPILQSLYKLPGKNNEQLRFALARTYKAPSTFALLPRRTLQRDNSEVNPDLGGNPSLRPELAWGLDLAYERFSDSGSSFSISGYGRRIEDVTRTLTSFQDGRWVSSAQNAGEARSYGIEMDAKMPLRSIAKTMPNIDLRFNISRNWSRVDSVPGPDNRLDEQIPVSGTVGIDYESDTGPFAMGGSFSYQGGGEVRITNEQFKYASHQRIFDAYLLYKFDNKYQLRLSLGNLLHQDQRAISRYVTARGNSAAYTREPSFTTIRAALEIKL